MTVSPSGGAACMFRTSAVAATAEDSRGFSRYKRYGPDSLAGLEAQARKAVPSLSEPREL